MKKMHIRGFGGLPLAAALFEVEKPRGCVLFVHGLKEHKERYYEFAEYLNGQGFVVLMADSRGHGESLSRNYPLGYMDGFQKLVEDVHILNRFLRKRYPSLPITLFGHSFGSMIARCYLEHYDTEIDKLILTGTPAYFPVVPAAVGLGLVITVLHGKRKYNPLLLFLGDNEGDSSWVNNDPKVLKEYLDDYLCTGYRYMNRSVLTIWETDWELGRTSHYECKNPNLPIYSLTGAMDPVSGGLSGLRRTMKLLEKIGYKDLHFHQYTGFAHELVNTGGNEKILAEIACFLKN